MHGWTTGVQSHPLPSLGSPGPSDCFASGGEADRNCRGPPPANSSSRDSAWLEKTPRSFGLNAGDVDDWCRCDVLPHSCCAVCSPGDTAHAQDELCHGPLGLQRPPPDHLCRTFSLAHRPALGASTSWGYTKIPAKAVIGLGWKCFRILYAQFLGGQSSPWRVLYAQLATIPSDEDIYTLSFPASTGCSLHGVPIVVRAQTPRHDNACRGCGRFYANLCAIPSGCVGSSNTRCFVHVCHFFISRLNNTSRIIYRFMLYSRASRCTSLSPHTRSRVCKSLHG